MKYTIAKAVQLFVRGTSTAALSLLFLWGISVEVSADEADAKRLLKAMSDYLVEQKALSFGYDVTLEVITKEGQNLGLAASGIVVLNRPDKIRATRSAGFADVEMLFDGKTLTLLGKIANRYTQVEVPGTLDNLIDELREKYHRPMPAADLLLTNPYETLLAEVVDVKDLGSGVIDGVECDHLAFRQEEVDWQIWIAQGERPYPCRYAITAKQVDQHPQYTIQVRNWRTGDEVAADDFAFKNPTNAEKIELKTLQEMMSDLPKHFIVGGE